MFRYENKDKLIDDLTLLFLKEGFNIQVYKAYTTNSVYIKLDYGFCYTIRISDHKGRSNLSYRYNIDVTRKKLVDRRVEYGRNRNYYGRYRIDVMIADILKCRNDKINEIGGISEYIKAKNEYRKQNKDNKGFWSKAIEYNIDDDTGKVIEWNVENASLLI